MDLTAVINTHNVCTNMPIKCIIHDYSKVYLGLYRKVHSCAGARGDPVFELLYIQKEQFSHLLL